MQRDFNLPIVHASSQSVTPTVPQDHPTRYNAPVFPQPSIYVRQQVCLIFFFHFVEGGYFPDLTQRQHSNATDSQRKAILA